MLFNSFDFLIFFPVLLLTYFILPRKIRWVWLLGCSAYFYMCWKAKYILLIGFSIGVTWLGSMIMDYCRNSGMPEEKEKRISILLCIFKCYYSICLIWAICGFLVLGFLTTFRMTQNLTVYFCNCWSKPPTYNL